MRWPWGMAYMTVAGMQGKRPIDVVYEEGCRGLAAGVDLYIAAGKAAVAGGLGPEAGEKFLEGYDKAVEIVEKIQEIESHAEELGDAVRDPIGYMQQKAPKVIQERAVQLLKEKTGLSDEVIDECTDQLGDAVQQVVQHVEYSRRIDEAYDKDRFLAELANEKTRQPGLPAEAPGDSISGQPPDESTRLRRITEQVCEEMAADGWRLGTVEVDLGAAAAAARSSLDCVVAWWNDARAGATRLTIVSAPVASGTTVAIPPGTPTDLIELADSGAIRRLTERPVVASAQGITRVAVRPPAVDARPEAVEPPPIRPTGPVHEPPAPRPEPPPQVGRWPNPEVFLTPGLHELRAAGDRCLVQAHPPRPMTADQAPEWQGTNGYYQLVYRQGGVPFFRGATHLYVRPLRANERPPMVNAGSDLQFGGTKWGPMKPLAADQSTFFTLRGGNGGIGISVVSAGGYVAVVKEIGSREDAELIRNMRLEFLRTIRDRLEKAGAQK